ncbi:MAG: CaiB/BaiF CoA-transferase family protein [Oscillospiraceae bacterium]
MHPRFSGLGRRRCKNRTPQRRILQNNRKTFRASFEEENNIFFTPYNVNKKSLCLNLKTPESIEILYKLLEGADVFATNTRPAAFEKMGLSLDTIREKFPRLIVVHLNGFGEKGEEKDRPGFDAAAFWCRGGAISEWTAAEDRPFKPFYGYGDAVTSTQLLAGVLSALYNRERTGKGDIVHVSLLAAGMWTNVAGIIRGQDVCYGQPPLSHYSPILPLDNFYKTKDGKWILISEEHWDKKCDTYLDLIGKPEYKGNPDYCSIMGAIKNTPELVKLFDEGLAKYTAEELKAVLISIDTVFEFVSNPSDVYKDKQAWDNDFLREVETVGGTKMVIPNNPILFDSQGSSECAPAPMLGENSVEVLEGLGYTKEQIAAFSENKSIIAR